MRPRQYVQRPSSWFAGTEHSGGHATVVSVDVQKLDHFVSVVTFSTAGFECFQVFVVGEFCVNPARTTGPATQVPQLFDSLHLSETEFYGDETAATVVRYMQPLQKGTHKHATQDMCS